MVGVCLVWSGKADHLLHLMASSNSLYEGLVDIGRGRLVLMDGKKEFSWMGACTGYQTRMFPPKKSLVWNLVLQHD
jgi:hypothetical protein